MSVISLLVMADGEGLETVGYVLESGEVVGVADVAKGMKMRGRSRPTAASTTIFRELDINGSGSVRGEGEWARDSNVRVWCEWGVRMARQKTSLSETVGLFIGENTAVNYCAASRDLKTLCCVTCVSCSTGFVRPFLGPTGPRTRDTITTRPVGRKQRSASKRGGRTSRSKGGQSNQFF
jgi:hypothetical protein